MGKKQEEELNNDIDSLKDEKKQSNKKLKNMSSQQKKPMTTQKMSKEDEQKAISMGHNMIQEEDWLNQIKQGFKAGILKKAGDAKSAKLNIFKNESPTTRMMHKGEADEDQSKGGNEDELKMVKIRKERPEDGKNDELNEKKIKKAKKNKDDYIDDDDDSSRKEEKAKATFDEEREEKVARRKGRKKEAAISNTDKEEKEETKGDEEAGGPVHKKKIKYSEEGHKAVDDDEPANKEQLKEAKQNMKEKSEAETEQNMR